MANIDIRLQTDFLIHPKTKELKRRLGSEAVLALQSLWVHAAQNKQSGVLYGMAAGNISDAANWAGNPEDFVNVLVEVGFLDENEETYSIHDWIEHQPWVVGALARSAQAKKAIEKRWADYRARQGKDTDSNTDSPNQKYPSPLPSLPILTSSKSKSTSSKEIQEFCELFKKHCPSLPKVRGLTGTRRRTIKTRLKEHPELEWWVDLFKSVEATPFLTGRAGGNKGQAWRANFDWILNPTNLIKIIEGNYSDHKQPEVSYGPGGEVHR